MGNIISIDSDRITRVGIGEQLSEDQILKLEKDFYFKDGDMVQAHKRVVAEQKRRIVNSIAQRLLADFDELIQYSETKYENGNVTFSGMLTIIKPKE